MSRACSELSNYQRLLIGMAYTPCCKSVKIMGQRLTQRIIECSLCGKVPADGEYIWEMGHEYWCEECCKKQEEAENEDE